MRIISGNHFHPNNNEDGDEDGNKVCGDGVGMGMLVHPRVTFLSCRQNDKI